MEDNHLFVRAPKNAGGFFTIEDAANDVLAWGRNIMAKQFEKIVSGVDKFPL